MALPCPSRVGILAVVTLVTATATATSIVPPESLGDLARMADAVVLAQAGASHAVRRSAILSTHTTFRVLETIGGPLSRGARFSVQVLGGATAEELWVFPGSPQFEAGGVYLLMLSEKADGFWIPQMASYGVLQRVRGRDGSTLLEPLAESGTIEAFPRPDGILPEPVETYAQDALLPHLRAVVAGTTRWDGNSVRARTQQLPIHVVALAAPPGCVFLGNGRWQNGNPAAMHASNVADTSIADGGYGEVQSALNVWGGMPSTSLSPAYGGTQAPTMTCTADFDTPAANLVVFNDPCSDLQDLTGCVGVLAQGGWGAYGQHTFDGTTWWSINHWYVVVNNGVGCIGSAYYTTMLAHEMGHGLGFGHTTDPNSLMYPVCCQGPDDLDRTCASYLYPLAGPTPTPTRTPTPIGPTPTPTRTPTTGPSPTPTPTTPASPPAAPTEVSASDGAFPGKVRVTWNPSSGADMYQVWRNTINDPYTATYLTVVTGTLYDDTTVSAGVTYYYWARAHNGAGWSVFSSPDTGYRGAAAPTPTPTGGLAASFNFAPTTPYAGEATQCTDTSSGVPRSWQWTFGDGGSSTERNPIHTWVKRGTYTVKLVVGNGSANAQTSKTLTVDARARRHLS